MNIALLCRLREAGGAFVPIDELGPSPEATTGDLDELVAFGFLIERHPYLGAAYLGPAGRLCPDQIEYQLGTRRIGRRVAVWNRVASTNDLAARAASSAANDGLVILAEEQSAGRGSRGRVWTAPPGSSVLMSVLLFPEGSLDEPGWLTALGAVAVAEVVSEWTGRPAAIKWPNDVRVDGLKVAGILVERAAGAVIGIGLNANLTADAFPEDLRDKAASLQSLNGGPVDRSELVRELLRRLDALYTLSEREGGRALNAPWRALSEHVGRRVVVSTSTGIVRGRVDDLDPIDGLRLTREGGPPSQIPVRHILSLTTEQG